MNAPQVISGQTVWVISDQGGERGSSIQSIAVFSDGIHAVADADGCSVSVIDVRTSNEITRFKYHEEHVCAVAVSPDCLTIVSGSKDNTTSVVAFSERGWELVKRLKNHNDVRVFGRAGSGCASIHTRIRTHTYRHTHTHTRTHVHTYTRTNTYTLATY